MDWLYTFLADLILILHFAFVAFVVAGWLTVWAEWLLRWGFVRNFWFRITHLLAIGVVASESLAGMVCPLTVWENNLRMLAAGGDPNRAGRDSFCRNQFLRFTTSSSERR